MVLGAACFLVQGQRGGCTGKKRGGVPAPLSLNSFFFCGLSLLIGFPRADTEKSGETIATPPPPPPPETGVPTGPDSGTEYRASIRPQGVAIVGIYPCGKARKPDGPGAPPRSGSSVPFSLSLDDPCPVLAVKGSASPRAAPWTAAGRAGEPDLLRGKRGECGKCRRWGFRTRSSRGGYSPVLIRLILSTGLAAPTTCSYLN